MLRIGLRASLAVYLCCLSLTGYAIDTEKWGEILSSDHRSNAHKQRDIYRRPVETLTFFEVEETDHIVEIWPGGSGWYTEILAPLLKSKGHLTAAHFSADSKVAYFRNSLANFKKKVAAEPDNYQHIQFSVLQPPESLSIAKANSADKVLTFRNVHNWMRNGQGQSVFNAMFAALKPGGVLGVVEHRAKPGTSLDDMITSGYVTEDYVKTLAAKAGFNFVGHSEINANVKDDREHPKGVWTLPPSLRLGEQDKETYLAIGESDRMTLKFQKPKAK